MALRLWSRRGGPPLRTLLRRVPAPARADTASVGITAAALDVAPCLSPASNCVWRVSCISTGAGGGGDRGAEEPVATRPDFLRARTRVQRTRESLAKTGRSLRATREKVTENVEQTKRIVTERMGHLRENVVTIPNALSLARLCSSPVLGYLVVTEGYTSALVLFAAAGVTDVLDGWVARSFPSQQSMLGTVVDPLADKCLVATLFLSLTVAGLIPVPLTALIVTRDITLVGCAGYLRFASLPAPKTFLRYFDVSLATVKFSPTSISKANTAVQLGLVAATLAAPVFGFVDHSALHAFWYLTASTTVLSGLTYLFTKDAYQFIRKDKS
ncbi:probable cardiolipin synthase (CMP-forming) [Dermacentor albipictus]|uniref:probable cardiolipin synthase (CMP-forming) n=1 Tax=Dermacentor albipictus TaxID=60249 RepID=UPI0038FC8A65